MATVLFAVLSTLFSFYTANLGSYSETYGPLATIIVLLLWFQLSDREWRDRTGLEDSTGAATDGGSAAQALFGRLAVPDMLREHLVGLFDALPDLALAVESTSATETTATIRQRMSGTFTGTPWAGVEPNRCRLDIEVVQFVTLDDGFIVEVDERFDTAALTEQLGFRPGDTSLAARMQRGLKRGLRCRGWRRRPARSSSPGSRGAR